MKFATLALVALPALALASPLSRRTYEHEEPKKEEHHPAAMDEHKMEENMLAGNVFDFTSTYIAYASPDQVINNDQVAVPGQEGAKGVFKYGIHAAEELICWNIAVEISGDYQSPARTATHIHEAPFGRAGPPRIAFPNPTSDSPIDEFGRRTSYGCMKGPFTTGVLANGVDTGTGFSLAQIEANPPAFFTDVHTTTNPAGAVRGQLELTGSAY